jgi:hypothetical protein
MRTPDWDRTSDLRIRNPALYPLSYEGMVGAERFELPERERNRVTAGPTSPSVARPLG